MELIECVKIPGVQSVYGLLELDQVLGMGEPLRMDASRKNEKTAISRGSSEWCRRRDLNPHSR
jgi:hypothetical protein